MKPVLLLAQSDGERCQVYQQALTEQGYEVATSSDGLDCMHKVRRLRPAVVVLDLDLRWGGGDGVLAWLRETGWPTLPSVILTLPAGADGGLAALTELPVAHCLLKPFPLPTLIESVRAALSLRQQVSRDEDPQPTLLGPCA